MAARTERVFADEEITNMMRGPIKRIDLVTGRAIMVERVLGSPMMLALTLEGPGLPHVGAFAVVHTQHVNMMAAVLLDGTYDTTLLR